MRIISSQKDFYDCFARNRNVSDQNYVWERSPKDFKIDFAIPHPVKLQTSFRFNSLDPVAYGFLIWFCGRVIPMIKVEHADKVVYLSDVKDLPSCFKNEYALKDLQKLFDCSKQNWMATDFKPILFSGNVVPPKIEPAEMHRRVKSPVFCHAGARNCLGKDCDHTFFEMFRGEAPSVIVNPVLSAVNLHKFVDAFGAFNELERFIANEMAPKDSRLDEPVPDKINAESHGFDKFSFRKERSKNKKP